MHRKFPGGWISGWGFMFPAHEGRVVLRAISDLCLRVFSVMDLSVHSLKAFRTKIRTTSAILPRRRNVSECETEPPNKTGALHPAQKSELHPQSFRARRQTSVSAVEPPKKSALCAPRVARAARSKKGAMHPFGFLFPTVCRWGRLPEIFRRKGPVNTDGYDRQ